MKKHSSSNNERKDYSINEILSFLEIGFKNINSVNKDVPNIRVKKFNLINIKTLECQFYTKNESSIDIKSEIASVMGAFHGFFKGDHFKNISLDYFAARAYDKKDTEIMYAISSKESVAFIGTGKSIDWLKSTIFQENTRDYRLGVAKRQISEIENALREVIVDRLSNKYGIEWFKKTSGNSLFKNVKATYFEQFGEEIEDGNILIKYTFLSQLRKIICANWPVFSDLFENKIKFEEYNKELNEIRREESHNRDISADHLKSLNNIYEFILINISEVYPKILPSYLIDNWKDSLKEIMFPKPDLPYTDSDIESESDDKLKFTKAISNLQRLVDHIKDKELKLRSIVVPVQKKMIHQELIEILNDYRILHQELIECGKTGKYLLVHAKQQELDLYRVNIREFSEKYIYKES